MIKIENQQRYIGADGDKTNKAFQTISEILNFGSNQYNLWKKPEQNTDNFGLTGTETQVNVNIGGDDFPSRKPEKKDTILGMNKTVFYPIVGVFSALAIIGIVFAVKKSK